MAPEIHAAEVRSEQIGRLTEVLRVEILAISAHETEVLRNRGEQQRAVVALEQTNTTIERHHRLVAELQEIPCLGRPPYDKCVKISTSMEAKQMLPGLHEERDRQEATVQRLTAIVEATTRNGCRAC